MAWSLPLTVEERLKAIFVPPAWQRAWHVAREKRRGEAEIHLVPILSDRARVSLDIGANKGIWTDVMREHACAVHAFEPNPKIYRVLQRGIRAGVTAHFLALSDRSGIAELRVPQGSRGWSNQGASLSAAKIGQTPYRSVEVPMRRLDELDLGDIGFIKLDVEGHELAVIAGAAETLRRCHPNLIVEKEEVHTRRPIAEMLAEVCAHGYEGFALDSGQLRRVAQIDLKARHDRGAGRGGYIFNWVFLPL